MSGELFDRFKDYVKKSYDCDVIMVDSTEGISYQELFGTSVVETDNNDNAAFFENSGSIVEYNDLTEIVYAHIDADMYNDYLVDFTLSNAA